jgi:hypothetical protein
MPVDYVAPAASRAPGPLVPQHVPALAPLLAGGCTDATDDELRQVFARVFEQTIRPALRDIDTLAMPQVGSAEQFEMAANRSGLGIYRRDEDEAMRYLYRSWTGRNPRRGLHMLRLYLRLLWPGGWTCDQLWHPEDKPYPTALNKTGGPGQFLTSRVEVNLIADDMDETDVLRILPALLSVVPARIVLDINVETRTRPIPIRLAVAASAVGIQIFSTRATTAKGAEAGGSQGLAAAAVALGYAWFEVDARTERRQE